MIDIIRAWKDAAYRNSLTAEQLASIPANPAGSIELSDTELGAVTGGRPKSDLTSMLQTCTAGTEDCCC
jgi:mersacidin/lichenicidin family type 2 lantibiotic